MTIYSVLRRTSRFSIKTIEKIGQIVRIFHVEIGLPASFDNGGRIRRRVPNAPTVFNFPKLKSHKPMIPHMGASL